MLGIPISPLTTEAGRASSPSVGSRCWGGARSERVGDRGLDQGPRPYPAARPLRPAAVH